LKLKKLFVKKKKSKKQNIRKDKNVRKSAAKKSAKNYNSENRMRIISKAKEVSEQKSRNRSYCQYSKQCSLYRCTDINRDSSENISTIKRNRQLNDIERENLNK